MASQQAEQGPLAPRTHDGDNIIDLDIAIVGGGVSGLYSALRLARSKQWKGKRIAVFDAFSRFGGRVNTLRFPKSVLPFAADAGAMRYIPTQVIINALIKSLNLESKVYVFDFPVDAYLVRGRHLSKGTDEGELTDCFSTEEASRTKAPCPGVQDAYRWLRESEKGKEPAELIALAIADLFKHIQIGPDAHNSDDPVWLHAPGPQELQDKIQRVGGSGLKIAFSDLDLAEWVAFKRYAVYEFTELYKLSFWDLIQSQLSSEAFALVEDGLGYQTIIGTWNAADAIPWFLADFRPVTEDAREIKETGSGDYLSLRGGMAQLTEGLQQVLLEELRASQSTSRQQASDSLFTNYTLKELTVESDGSILLRFEEYYHETTYAATFDRSKKEVGPYERLYRAKKVVLAMSPGAISKVEINGIGEETRESFVTLLTSVTSHALLKMFMFFRMPWWWDGLPDSQRSSMPGTAMVEDKQEFKANRTFTSLPLRMLYSHGPQSDSNVRSQGDQVSQWQARMSMVMAYCDARHASYWDSLRTQGVTVYKSGDLARTIQDMGSDEDRRQMLRLLEQYGVSEVFAARAHDQLWRAYRHRIFDSGFQKLGQPTKKGLASGGESVPLSETVLYMNWGTFPFYGGWHSWNVGVKSSDVKAKIVRPLGGFEVYICGEAFSSDQGWIEGALRSAEGMLIDHFELEAPEWLALESVLGKRGFETYVHW